MLTEVDVNVSTVSTMSQHEEWSCTRTEVCATFYPFLSFIPRNLSSLSFTFISTQLFPSACVLLSKVHHSNHSLLFCHFWLSLFRSDAFLKILIRFFPLHFLLWPSIRSKIHVILITPSCNPYFLFWLLPLQILIIFFSLLSQCDVFCSVTGLSKQFKWPF